MQNLRLNFIKNKHKTIFFLFFSAHRFLNLPQRNAKSENHESIIMIIDRAFHSMNTKPALFKYDTKTTIDPNSLVCSLQNPVLIIKCLNEN